jgi:hypothetical protein
LIGSHSTLPLVVFSGSSPSEEEKEEDSEREYDEYEMTLFIKKFKKFIKKRRPYKGERKEKLRPKRVCYNCDKNVHFIAQCIYKRKEEDNARERSLTKGARKIRNTLRKSFMIKPMLAKNETQMMKVLSQKVMRWQPYLSRVKPHQASHSSPSS